MLGWAVCQHVLVYKVVARGHNIPLKVRFTIVCFGKGFGPGAPAQQGPNPRKLSELRIKGLVVVIPQSGSYVFLE
jgi:hypothetical protein